jgi:hypothetical protein
MIYDGGMTNPADPREVKARMHEVHAKLYDANSELFDAMSHLDTISLEWQLLRMAQQKISRTMKYLYDSHNLGGADDTTALSTTNLATAIQNTVDSATEERE